MDDESEEPRKQYPLSPAKMSKTPSWVMLGFVLGAATVWSLQGQMRKASASAALRAQKIASAPEVTTVRYVPQPVSTIDAVFGDWAHYAVWEHDITEVALWSKDAGAFADCYEVMRYAGKYYFRPIPELTRRVIRRGKEIPGCPLLFTETEEQYQEWRQHGRSERPVGDYRPVSAFPPAQSTQPRPTTVPKPNIEAPKFEALVPFEAPPLKSGEPKK